MPLARRALLAAASLLASGRAVAAGEVASVLVAGPDGGRMAAWLLQLSPGLLAGIGATAPGLTSQTEGGADGVTGANVFETRFSPAGTGLLLAPGDAARVWLAGDARVHFDVARWLPVLSGVSTGALVCRRSLASAAARPWRVAMASALEPATAMLLGLELLGVPADPVAGVADPLRALATGQIDAAFIPGVEAAAVAGALNAAAVFSFGEVDADDLASPDPLLADVPSLGAQIVASGGTDTALLSAWRAAAAASMLDFALVLQALTAAPEVTIWRKAGQNAQAQGVQTQGVQTQGVQTQGMAVTSSGPTRLLAAPACNAMMARIAADSPGLLAYRAWLTRRLGWQPG